MRFQPVVNHISEGVRTTYQAAVRDMTDPSGGMYRIDPLGEPTNFYSEAVAVGCAERTAKALNDKGFIDPKVYPNVVRI